VSTLFNSDVQKLTSLVPLSACAATSTSVSTDSVELYKCFIIIVIVIIIIINVCSILFPCVFFCFHIVYFHHFE